MYLIFQRFNTITKMITVCDINHWKNAYENGIRNLVNSILRLENRNEYGSILWVLLEPLFVIYAGCLHMDGHTIDPIYSIVKFANRAIDKAIKSGESGCFNELLRQEIGKLLHKKMCDKCKRTNCCTECNTCEQFHVITNEGGEYLINYNVDNSHCKRCNPVHPKLPNCIDYALTTIDRCIMNPGVDMFYTTYYYRSFIEVSDDPDRSMLVDWIVPFVAFFGDALSTIYPGVLIRHFPKIILYHSLEDPQSKPIIKT